MSARLPAAAVVVAIAAFALTACGGDDDTTSIPEGPSGTSGAQGAEVDSAITAGDFLELPIPDQLSAVEHAVDENSDCGDVDTSAGGDFQVSVAIDAAQATPDTPLADVIAKAC